MDTAVPEFELQQEIQRFTTQFVDRVTQAAEDLERTARPEVRDEALRKNLLYVSSAMEIASGPFAEVNLLDMIVFVRLSRSVLEHHWIPELYGLAGAPIADVFARSEEELDGVAARALSPEQRAQLARLVDAWLADNPGQVRVEGVRLADFSEKAGVAAADRAAQARGLLASVKTASRAANQALLLSERAMFLLHRMPSLWRLQARLGAREVLGDALEQLARGPDSVVGEMRRAGQELGRRARLYAAAIGIGALGLWGLATLAQRRRR